MVVGFSSVSDESNQFDFIQSSTQNGQVVGILLIFLAQLFSATQFVIEEKVLGKYDVEPLKAVGLEGTFGLISILAMLPLLYYGIGINGKKGGDILINYVFI